MCCMRLAGNTGCKKSPSAHHRTTLSGYIFVIKARVDNRKNKLVKQQYLTHVLLQYGELWPTNSWDLLASLGHPSKFQRLSRLGSVTARHLVVGVSQTLRRWTERAICVRQGDHHVGHWPTLHGTLVVGIGQTLRRSTEGAAYIRQGGHHVGHWPKF